MHQSSLTLTYLQWGDNPGPGCIQSPYCSMLEMVTREAEAEMCRSLSLSTLKRVTQAEIRPSAALGWASSTLTRSLGMVASLRASGRGQVGCASCPPLPALFF